MRGALQKISVLILLAGCPAGPVDSTDAGSTDSGTTEARDAGHEPDAGPTDSGTPPADGGPPDSGTPPPDAGFTLTWSEPLPPLPFDADEGVIAGPAGAPLVFHCSGTSLDAYGADGGGWSQRTLAGSACTQAIALDSETVVTSEPSINGVRLALVSDPDAGLEVPMPSWVAVAGRTGPAPVIAITTDTALQLYSTTGGLALESETVSPAASPNVFFGGRAVRTPDGGVIAAWSQAKRIVAGAFDGATWSDLQSSSFNSHYQEYPPGLALTAAGAPVVVTNGVFQWSGSGWTALGGLNVAGVDYVEVPLVVADPADGSLLIAWRAGRAGSLSKPTLISRVAGGVVTVIFDEAGLPATVNSPRGLWLDGGGRLWLAVSERANTGATTRLRFFRSTPLR